jgi:integrase
MGFSVKTIQALQAGQRVHSGERGLYCAASETGSRKRWVLRYVSPVTFRVSEAGGGSFPEVSIAEAREWAATFRAQVRRGVDPVQAKREARRIAKVQEKAALPLADAVAAYAQAFATKSTTAELVALLNRHVSALLSRPLASITSDDVLTALMPLQARQPKSVPGVRRAISTVFDYAIARGLHTGANPASATAFRYLLPAAPAAVSHRMCPVDQVPALFTRLQAKGSATSLCLAFVIACALRSGEAIRCRWEEIDWDRRLLVISKERMKMKREFRCPLNDAAIGVLMKARALWGREGYVFKNAGGGHLSPRSLEALLHQTLKAPYAVHGFRGSFSTWAHNGTEFPHELIELSLAHEEGRGNSVARAYNKGDGLERRRTLMGAWSDHLTGVTAASNVVILAQIKGQGVSAGIG